MVNRANFGLFALRGASFAVVFLFLLLPFVSAQCSFLSVGAISAATVKKGVQAGFPILIKNNGLNSQSLALNAINPATGELTAYFDTSYYTLQSGEEKEFHVFVGTANAQVKVYSIPLEISTDQGVGTCYENKNLILNVTPADPVNASTGVEVTIDPTNVTQRFVGESVTFNIISTNNGGEDVLISIDDPVNPLHASTTFSLASFRLRPGETKAVKAKVTITPGTPANTYNLVFRANVGSNCCTKEVLLPVSLVCVFGDELRLTVLKDIIECKEIKLGGSTNFMEVGLRNDGRIEGPFHLELQGTPQALSTVKLPFETFSLKQGERIFFNISLSPPSSLPIDHYRYNLVVRYNGFTSYFTELCYDLMGTSDFVLEKPAKAEVNRCESDSFQFLARNTGTIANNYAVELRPPVNATIHADPETFQLNPGETQLINVIIGTTCATPLGTQTVPITVRSQNATRTENFMFAVKSSGKAGQSLLALTAPQQISIVRGQQNTVTVSVRNNAPYTSDDTQVTITGMPESWIKYGLPQSIRSGASASFDIKINPATTGNYPLSIQASSGLESVTAVSQAVVEDALKQLDYSYRYEKVEVEGITTEVILYLTVTNQGNVEMNGITAGTSESDINAVAIDQLNELKPRETRTIRVSLRPLQDTSQKVIPIRLRSSDGTTASKDIEIPALSPTGKFTAASQQEFPWKVLAIIVLLIAIFAVLAKDQPSSA